MKKYITNGTMEFKDYKTFESDENHEQMDGYEWKTVEVCFRYDDETAHVYGTGSFLFSTDYYNCEPKGESGGMLKDEETVYTVNYYGIDYEDCLAKEEVLTMRWIDNIYTCDVLLSFRVPVGYDGVVVGVIEDGKYEEGDYLYDIATDDTELFLLRLG